MASRALAKPGNKEYNVNSLITMLRTLQRWLNALGYTDENEHPLAVDGSFGDHTLAAMVSPYILTGEEEKSRV